MMIPKRLLIAVVAIALVVAMLFVIGIIPLQFGRVDIEPKTQHHWRMDGNFVGNYDGTNKVAYELITNPVGGSTGHRSAFLIAKTEDGESEFITAQGYGWRAIPWGALLTGKGASFSDASYRIKHKSPIGDWVTIADKTGNKVAWLNYDNPGNIQIVTIFDGVLQKFGIAKSITFSILGDHPGAIRVELIGKFQWSYVDGFHDYVISSDEAELLPSGGLIERTQNRATYEIGETMEMRISTDFSGSTVGEQAKGYMVIIRNPDGDKVWTKNLKDDWDGTISVTIEDDWYSPDWDNRFQVELVNQFRDLGVVSFFAIDVLGKAPAKCSITSTASGNNNKVEGGTTLSVTFTAEEKVGAVEVENFRYCMFFGASDGSTEPQSTSSAWIQKWVSTSASKTGDVYTAIVSISIPKNVGYATILGVTIGEGNRAAEEIRPYGVNIWVDVEPDDAQLDPNKLGEGDAYIGGRTTNWYDWILPGDPGITDDFAINWIGVLVAAIIIGMFVVAGLKMPGRKENKIIVGVIGIIVAVVVYAYYFTSIFTGG